MGIANFIKFSQALRIPAKGRSIPLTSSHTLAAGEDSILQRNLTANNYTLTVPAGLPVDFGSAGAQRSTGTVGYAAGSGVTLIGATLATSGQGQIASLIYVDVDTYIVKVS